MSYLCNFDWCYTWSYGRKLCASLLSLQFDRDWFAEGSLPSFPGGPKFSETTAVRLSHRLADSLFKLRKMVHSTKVKLQAARWDTQILHKQCKCGQVINTRGVNCIHRGLMLGIYRTFCWLPSVLWRLINSLGPKFSSQGHFHSLQLLNVPQFLFSQLVRLKTAPRGNFSHA